MTIQFYRKAAVCAMLTWAGLSVAQVTTTDSKQKAHSGPRAISVLEMDAKGQARLVPVTILVQDHYYDASQYQANPVPMAAEPGNVYDVLEGNTPIGLFTTAGAQQVRGAWVSAGAWKGKSEEPEKKPAKVEVDLGKDDDHPVLHRRGEASSPSAGSDSPKPKADDDPDRPTLKKPQPAAADSKPTADSPDKTSTPQVAKRTAAPVDDNLARDENSNDPDRPVLRKTAAGSNPSDIKVSLPDPVTPARTASPAKVAPQTVPDQIKQYIAVSDEQKTDYRPFAYQLKEDEKKTLTGKLQKIAATNLQKWALAHGGVKLPANLAFTDFDVRAFDVDYSNNPELVFMASYTPGPVKTKPPTFYLTLVAREDANGDLSPIFSQITDSTRLDAYSRLELIDAVDADGMGRGSLIFREYTDSGKAFVMYRVDAYNLTKLFEGASGE